MKAEAPHCVIANRAIEAQVFLPDGDCGFYRGTRFDWSGIVASLRYRDHEYISPWKNFHDPLFHDCITGPAEEFEGADTPERDFQIAAEGSPFLRLGVGLLRKAGEGSFQRFHTYPLVDATGWQAFAGCDRVEFQHTAASPTGLSYRYRKTVRLDARGPILWLEHSLVNAGRIPIVTRQYNHNFFRIDDILPGPTLRITTPFPLSTTHPIREPLTIHGCVASLTRKLQAGENVLAEVICHNKRYEVEIFQQASQAGVTLRGDHPLTRLLLWASHRVFCPEPYIDICAGPGESFSWNLSYTFWTDRG